MDIEAVAALSPAELATCDFSFEIASELTAPYQDLLADRPIPPRRKDYGFDPAGWTAQAPERKALFQARVAGRLAGFAVISEIWNGMAEIREIGVDRAFRRGGVASALLTAAEDWAKSRRFRFIRIETQANNPAACKTYARSGFVLGGHDRFLYGAGADAGEVALFWYKALG